MDMKRKCVYIFLFFFVVSFFVVIANPEGEYLKQGKTPTLEGGAVAILWLCLWVESFFFAVIGVRGVKNQKLPDIDLGWLPVKPKVILHGKEARLRAGSLLLVAVFLAILPVLWVIYII